jgi:hypothetical protein
VKKMLAPDRRSEHRQKVGRERRVRLGRHIKRRGIRVFDGSLVPDEDDLRFRWAGGKWKFQEFVFSPGRVNLRGIGRFLGRDLQMGGAGGGGGVFEQVRFEF